MNVLLDGLPAAIEIAGKEYPINADYQTGLRIISAFEDEELTDYERCAVLVALLYRAPPEDFPEAVRLGVKFIDCGREDKSEASADTNRYYSFSFDAQWIYAGVDRVLHGRLSRGEFVHWWEFVTAFMELPEDCMMSRILDLRQQMAKGKLTLEERRQWAVQRDILELPVELSREEQAAADEFMRKLVNHG